MLGGLLQAHEPLPPKPKQGGGFQDYADPLCLFSTLLRIAEKLLSMATMGKLT